MQPPTVLFLFLYNLISDLSGAWKTLHLIIMFILSRKWQSDPATGFCGPQRLQPLTQEMGFSKICYIPPHPISSARRLVGVCMIERDWHCESEFTWVTEMVSQIWEGIGIKEELDGTLQISFHTDISNKQASKLQQKHCGSITCQVR